jgi:DNA polymerase V
MFTMGDVARCSLTGEDVLFKLFGVNAELLIDHAWGWENCTMADIKAYRPSANSVGMGQVLHEPYNWDKAKLIVREMADLLVLDLVDKGLTTDQIVLTVGYDRESLENPQIRQGYHGEVVLDHYGRAVPKHGHGTANLGCFTASTKVITDAMMDLFDRITDQNLLVRRINIVACRVKWATDNAPMQLDFFADPRETEFLEKEKRRQKAVLQIRKKYGKNAILKGMNFQEGATTRARNAQIGGHKA